MRLPRVVKRLLALCQGRRLDAELDSEILAHLELAERDAIAAGVPPDQARLAARRRFGGIEQIKEEHRDARSTRWLQTLLRDARYGLAGLGRDRGFTAVAICVLALGIGANAAVFSLVDAALLQPLPFRDPDRIVRLWEAPRPGVTNATSTLDFLDWKRMAAGFEAMSAERDVAAALTGAGDPVRLSGSAVTADYFRVFDVQAVLGRTFMPDEDRAGGPPVVVLSHRAWRTYFGADPGVLHHRILLDGRAHEVIGVLPPGPFDRGDAAFWIPLVFTPDLLNRERLWLTVSGRLRAGVTIGQAREQMRAVHAALASEMSARQREWSLEVEPLASLLTGEGLQRSLLVASGAVVLVLLIACANVANLLLAKGAARTREMAVRIALGASRGRLVSQLLTETLVLCLLGGAAGAALASVLVRLMDPLVAGSIPPTVEIAVNGRVLAFTAAVAVAAAVFVGVLPALHASFASVTSTSIQSWRGSGRRGAIRRAIVISEVSLSLVLVCGAVLLFLTLRNLERLDTGINADHVLTMRLDLPDSAYATPERTALFYDVLVDRLQALPDVSRAGLATVLPLRWIGNGEGLRLAGADEQINVRLKRVDAGYFDTLGIRVAAGRSLAVEDRHGAPSVIVINEALAKRLLEGGRIANPVGQNVQLTYIDYSGQPARLDGRIAGVMRSERVGNPWRPDPPVAYVPLAQAPVRSLNLLVHTRGDADAVPAIREAIRAIDPDLPLGAVSTMEEVRDRTFLPFSRPAWLIGIFAAVAALLAGLGLYGVLAQSVTDRRHELGIRLALGAASRTMVGHIVGHAFRMIAAGLVIGVIGSLVLTRAMRGLLFGVSPLDPRALAAAAILIMGVGLTAALIPARRAARLDPITALRGEG